MTTSYERDNFRYQVSVVPDCGEIDTSMLSLSLESNSSSLLTSADLKGLGEVSIDVTDLSYSSSMIAIRSEAAKIADRILSRVGYHGNIQMWRMVTLGVEGRPNSVERYKKVWRGLFTPDEISKLEQSELLPEFEPQDGSPPHFVGFMRSKRSRFADLVNVSHTTRNALFLISRDSAVISQDRVNEWLRIAIPKAGNRGSRLRGEVAWYDIAKYLSHHGVIVCNFSGEFDDWGVVVTLWGAREFYPALFSPNEWENNIGELVTA